MKLPTQVFPGSPYPLGATWDGRGVNFAIFSESADAVDLCLFDDAYDSQEAVSVPMKERTDNVFHVYLPEARPGLMYGYRVSGSYEPEKGLRFNRNKLLLDPYAKALTGTVEWSDAMFGYPLNGDDERDLQFSDMDSAPGMPKAVVIEQAFSWGDDAPLKTPWDRTVIYETHVRGFTIQNPELPAELRGTYAGLAHHRTIRYLQNLGVTAVELMPIHHFVHDRHLVEKGLRNYWGYNTIGFFAPHIGYASAAGYGAAINEFKTMVRTLHAAGIEVILDVVYNHTAEGNHFGPTLSFRGVDNQSYYRLVAGQERYYMDYTGTGNTLNMRHPRSIQLIMDSLRYWVQDMHIDGFRFDLASALARELHEVDRLSTFFDVIHQDPVISQVKLIAEPWDVGEGGYQVGNFPVLWTEWNGRYRDTVRRFWRGDPGLAGDLGSRLTGSSDLYAHNGRTPYASINFVTCHDGFTLNDLVSYNDKHNEANLEDNRDGANDNNSWNGGVEGPTDDRSIIELRERQARNLMTTLMISQGVPMLLHGDEVLRTQKGSNNAYCQDNEITWQKWDWTPRERSMFRWTQRLIGFRNRHPVLRRREFFRGRPIRGAGTRDIVWYNPQGDEMTDEQWSDQATRAIGVYLFGGAADLIDSRGIQQTDESIMMLMNSHDDSVDFQLAVCPIEGEDWAVALDSAAPNEREGRRRVNGGEAVQLVGRSIMVLTTPAVSE